MLRRQRQDFPPFPASGQLRAWAWALEQTEVRFLTAWEQECLLGWHLASRALPHSLAVFVHEGRSHWQVGRETMLLRAGDLLLVPEGIRHSAKVVAPHPFRATFVHFTARVFGVRCLLSLLGFPHHWQERESLSETMTELARLAAHQPIGWQVRGSALLTNLLVAFVQEAPQRFQPTLAPKDARAMQWLCPAFQLAASADWKVTVSDLARTVACSPTHLRRLFQQAFGVSPRQWLLEQRLQRAAYLLQVTEKSVQQIADICGFDSLSHFTRYFRRKFGCSPAQYRKSLWQERTGGQRDVVSEFAV